MKLRHLPWFCLFGTLLTVNGAPHGREQLPPLDHGKFQPKNPDSIHHSDKHSVSPDHVKVKNDNGLAENDHLNDPDKHSSLPDQGSDPVKVKKDNESDEKKHDDGRTENDHLKDPDKHSALPDQGSDPVKVKKDNEPDERKHDDGRPENDHLNDPDKHSGLPDQGSDPVKVKKDNEPDERKHDDGRAENDHLNDPDKHNVLPDQGSDLVKGENGNELDERKPKNGLPAKYHLPDISGEQPNQDVAGGNQPPRLKSKNDQNLRITHMGQASKDYNQLNSNDLTDKSNKNVIIGEDNLNNPHGGLRKNGKAQKGNRKFIEGVVVPDSPRQKTNNGAKDPIVEEAEKKSQDTKGMLPDKTKDEAVENAQKDSVPYKNKNSQPLNKNQETNENNNEKTKLKNLNLPNNSINTNGIQQKGEDHSIKDKVKNPKKFVIEINDYENQGNSHFFVYFVSIVVLCIISYLAFHNKKKGATNVMGYFPTGIWYHYDQNSTVNSRGMNKLIETPLDKINIYFRGGSVIPTQVPAVTTEQSRLNDFRIVVAFDKNGTATGSLYLDDGITTDPVESGNYATIEFVALLRGWFYSHPVKKGYVSKQTVGQVTFLGMSEGAPSQISANGQPAKFTFDKERSIMVVNKLNLPLNEKIDIIWKY